MAAVVVVVGLAVPGSALASTGWGALVPADPLFAGTSVSCPSTSFCAAVDVGGHALIYTGASWGVAVPIDAGAMLDSVSCSSVSFCVAVDNQGNALSYNGSSWGAPVASTEGTC